MRHLKNRFSKWTIGALVLALLLAGAGVFGSAGNVGAFVQSDPLRKFIQPLPMLGTDIPVATPQPDPVFPNTDYYEFEIGQYTQQLHPDLPKPTTLWGYRQMGGQFRHLGPAIVAQKGRAVRVRFTNNLPSQHLLPIDRTIMGAEGADNRAVIHLHGGFSPWLSDGIPTAWFSPDGSGGVSFKNGPGSVFDNISGKLMTLGQADFFYSNQEDSSRLEWYHDHALGTTRLNAYAGLAAPYIIRDAVETSMYSKGLPSGNREIPLIFQDKIFVPQNIAVQDPTWDTTKWGQPGDLWYPHEYDITRWALGPGLPPPNPSVVPEMFGDIMMVNGKPYPYLQVKPFRYRFRMLNAQQARFMRLRIIPAKLPGGTEADLASTATVPSFRHIGNECGFLNGSVYPQGIVTTQVILAPAERADVIIDFSKIPVGSKLILYNDAPAPFPTGDPINDFQGVGSGPDTYTVMQFQVVAAAPGDPADPLMTFRLPTVNPLSYDANTPIKIKTLNEDFDEYGRLRQRLGDVTPRGYMDNPVTETATVGETQIWWVFNTTGDTHPIHTHLTNWQVLYRQKFEIDWVKYPTTGFDPNNIVFVGGQTSISPDEKGWKETVKMPPGYQDLATKKTYGIMTAVIAKYNLPNVPFVIPHNVRPLDMMMPVGPNNPLTDFVNEYVWHCHILDHEEHDMMRPLIITP